MDGAQVRGGARTPIRRPVSFLGRGWAGAGARVHDHVDIVVRDAVLQLVRCNALQRRADLETERGATGG